MLFSKHAKFKLSIYEIEEREILEAINSVVLDCEDVVEDSRILVINFRNRPFVVVTAMENEKILTLYPTDNQTI